MSTLPIPQFIERDIDKIISELKADYEARTGRVLQPAQVETLLLNTYAYRELLMRNQLQDGLLQNLVSFARFPALDYLGELVGVTRLAAQQARTTIKFTLEEGHPLVAIPDGTRIASRDGRVVFQTLSEVVAGVGVDEVEVSAECLTPGLIGSDYAPGEITEIQDPVAYVTEATNLTTTSGGSDEETDDQLRERIKLAPEAFSNAGSRGAYEFHAKSASPLIIDVAVLQGNPGEVLIYPLVADAEPTPAEIIEAVETVCSDEKVRPLTDTVIVEAPNVIPTEIDADITIYSDYDWADVEPAIRAACEAYADEKRTRLGKDIVPSEVIKVIQSVEGVYSVGMNIPTVIIPVAANEVADVVQISVGLIGSTNG